MGSLISCNCESQIRPRKRKAFFQIFFHCWWLSDWSCKMTWWWNPTHTHTHRDTALIYPIQLGFLSFLSQNPWSNNQELFLFLGYKDIWVLFSTRKSFPLVKIDSIIERNIAENFVTKTGNLIIHSLMCIEI